MIKSATEAELQVASILLYPDAHRNRKVSECNPEMKYPRKPGWPRGQVACWEGSSATLVDDYPVPSFKPTEGELSSRGKFIHERVLIPATVLL